MSKDIIFVAPKSAEEWVDLAWKYCNGRWTPNYHQYYGPEDGYNERTQEEADELNSKYGEGVFIGKHPKTNDVRQLYTNFEYGKSVIIIRTADVFDYMLDEDERDEDNATEYSLFFLVDGDLTIDEIMSYDLEKEYNRF